MERTECPPESELRKLLDDTAPVDGTVGMHVDQCKSCQQVLERMTDELLAQQYRPADTVTDSIDHSVAASREVQVDGFLLTEKIGSGGMGHVYRGREVALNREVAVKVIRIAANETAVGRFEREAKAAGQLRSDYLVPVYATGRVPDGRPYLVMPLISGSTLKDRVQDEPGLPKTVQWIRQIALGLQTAHDNGLIHRDVKPGNVLIDETDGRAKLTDFGLVRIEDDTTLTRADVVCGTPEYISPEQAGGLRNVDARSDIYSLGITLYYCLTGTPPFRGLPMEVLDQHRQDDPIPPARLNRLIDTDLETVCLKAVEKSPDQRYPTAQAFADDLQRWLDGKPVHARRPTQFERFVKFCSRNKGLVTSAATIFAILIGATAVSSWFAVQSNRSAESAERRLAMAVESFQTIDPRFGARKGMLAKEMLLKTRDNILASMIDDGEGQAVLLGSLGQSFQGLGELSLAADTYEEALLYFVNEETDQTNKTALELKESLAGVYIELEQLDSAEKILNEAKSGYVNLFGSDDAKTILLEALEVHLLIKQGDIKSSVELAETVEAKFEGLGLKNTDEYLFHRKNFALAYQEAGDNESAKEILESLLALRSELNGEDSPGALETASTLAVCYGDLGDYDKAIATGESALEIQRAKLESNHPITAASISNLASFYANTGNYDKALEYASESVELAEQTYGLNSTETNSFRYTLASVQFLLGKRDLAVKNLEAVFFFQRDELGMMHPETIATANNLAIMYSRMGYREKALDLEKQLLDASIETLGEKHPKTLELRRNLVVTLYYCDQVEDAVKMSAKAIELMKEVHGEEHPDTLAAITNHGGLLLRIARYEEAIEALNDAYEATKRGLGETNPDTIHALTELAKCYSRMGEHQQGIDLYYEAFQLADEHLGPEHPRTLGYLQDMAIAFRKACLFEDAYRFCIIAAERRIDSLGESHHKSTIAIFNLATVEQMTDRIDDAAEHFRKTFDLEKELLGPASDDTIGTLERLIQCQLHGQDGKSSLESAKELNAIVESGDDDVRDKHRANALICLAEAQAAIGAIDLAQESVGEVDESTLDSDWLRGRMLIVQARVAEDQEDPMLAIQLLGEASELFDGDFDSIREIDYWLPLACMAKLVELAEQLEPDALSDWQEKQAEFENRIKKELEPKATFEIKN